VVEDEMAGPDITFRMLMGLQKLRKIMPLEMAVLSSCRGNKILAQSLYEVLQLTDSEEDEPEPAEYSKGVGSTGSVCRNCEYCRLREPWQGFRRRDRCR
jgi:hypothetical protein